MRYKIFITILMLCLMAGARPVHAASGGPHIIRDDEIERTLRLYGTPIFESAGLSPQTVRFVLVEDGDLNAFVAGGQNIFINTGLILKTENPDELVGVIAHETGHIAGGHLFRLQEASEDMSLQAMAANILGVAAAIGTRSGDLGMAISSAGQSVALRGMLRHSRVQESSADQAGVRFLKDARLPLGGFLSFMKKLEAQELLPESEQSAYVRTHPMTHDRVDFLDNAVARAPVMAIPANWGGYHTRMKAKLEGFLFPDRVLGSRYREAALASGYTEIDADYAIAIGWYRRGNTTKSVEMIDGLLQQEPDNPFFWELKGQVLFEAGKITEAVDAYAKAVELLPSAGLIGAAYGHALLEAGKLEAAISALSQSLQTEPRLPRSHHLLAIAYGRKGEEGLSRLHLAEEDLLKNNLPDAKREAELAKAALPTTAPGYARAKDILDLIARKDKR